MINTASRERERERERDYLPQAGVTLTDFFKKFFSKKVAALVFCAVFLFFGVASHANATDITGASWPISGAATTGTTGFSSITGGTHVGSVDLPPGSTSTGYITGANNTTLGFRVDGTAVPLQTDNDYWLRYWVRASRNGTTLAADGALVNHQYVIDGSTKLNNVWYLRNNSVSNGFGFGVGEFLPGGTTLGINGTTASAAPAMLPFNQWSEITVHLHKDGKNGEYAMYFNRSLVRLRKDIPTVQHRATFTVDASTDIITSVSHNMVEGETVTLTTTGVLPAGLSTVTTYYVRNPLTNTFQLSLTSGGAVIDITNVGTGVHTYDNGGISLVALGSQWAMSLTGINGVTWQIAGPISTSSQATITNTPLIDTFTTSNDWVTKVYPTSYNNLIYGGDFWQQTAGSMSVTATDYCSGGACPLSKRFILSGSATDTATLSTNMDIGSLPYNSDGWATLFFPMIYLPSSGVLNIVINDTVGNSIYQVDISDGFLKQSGVNKAPWTQGDRYFLALHFSNSGQVNYSLHDLTADVLSQNFWSGQLASWTPQTIGRVNYIATRGSASLELDGLAIARWLPLFGLDSLTAAPTNLLTPVLVTANHVTGSLVMADELTMLPGAMYFYHANNIPRFFAWGIIGRSGRTRQNFTDNILPYMTYTRGVVMTFIDGGSINDIGPIGSNESIRTTVVNTLISQLNSAISQFTGSQNKVWLTTMIDRVQGSTYTSTQRNAILDYNIGIRNLHQTFPFVYFSDPANDIADHSTLFSIGDDTHFNAAGDITYSTNMVVDMVNNPPTNIGISSITRDSASQLTVTALTAEDFGSGLNVTPYYFTETSGNPGGSSSSDWQTSTAFVDTGLSANTQYTYEVKARDANLNQSAYSATVSKYTLAPTPTNFSAHTNSDSITVSADIFTNSTNASSGYYFSRSGGGNSGWIQTNSWEETGLACGTSYSYSVKYRNGDGVETDQSSVTGSTNSCGGGMIWGSGPNAPGYQRGVVAQAVAQTATLGGGPVSKLATAIASTTPAMVQSSKRLIFPKNLKLWDKGEDVRGLQKFLNMHKFMVSKNGVGSLGHESFTFGLATYRALVRFQRANGIQPTGYLGPITRRSIANMSAN